MTELTKEKAIQLDELLIQIHNTATTSVDVMEAAKAIESLKDKDHDYILGLLYIVKQFPLNIPQFFPRVTQRIQVEYPTLKQFLHSGGAKKIRKLRIREKVLRSASYWTLFIFSGVAALYSVLTYEFPRNEKQKQLKPKEQVMPLPKVVPKDSLKNPIQSPKNDSNNKGHSSEKKIS